MQFNSINHYQPTFQSATPIVATSKGKAALERALAGKDNQCRLLDLTDYFQHNTGENPKKFLFLLTGQEYIDDMFMRNGWEDILAPLRYANRASVNITENSKTLISKLLKRVSVKKDLEVVNNFNKKVERSGPNLKGVSRSCAF